MGNGKYLDIFLREAEEHLTDLQKGLLRLEKEPVDRETVHGILRNAHTLKGSARMLGFENISSIAHRMEDLLQEVEAGSRQVDSGLVDLLLRGSDAISLITSALARGEELVIDPEELLTAGNGVGRSAKESEPAPVSEGTEADTVRASVTTLDSLVNIIGEMIINKKRFEDKLSRLRSLCRESDDSLPVAAVAEFNRDLEQDVLYLSYLIEEVHGKALALRMLPLKTITGALERMVRDLAKGQGKHVKFELAGDGIELDRVLLETLKPSFMHMLTNAVDHGIELPDDRLAAGKPPEGTIRIVARYEGGGVRIDVSDDGRGIDPRRMRETAVRRNLGKKEDIDLLSDEEALNLCFRPGFSTSEIVTDLSGRGVGMDVVQRNVDRVKGTVTLSSEQGKGTRISLSLPLTLSVIDALLVSCADEFYAIPLTYVQETLKVRSEDIQTVGAKEVINVHGSTVMLVSLAAVLGFAEKKTLLPSKKLEVVVLKLRDQFLGCSIDGDLGSAEIVVKGLGEQLKNLQCVSGATILGDGYPALILNVADVFACAEGASGTSYKRALEEQAEERSKGRILVVDDSITTRTMERSILVANGYTVDVAVSGEDALGKASESAFDLVVSDIEMPGIDGFDLTKRLRTMGDYREVPVIIVSSRSRDEDKRRAIEAGAQAYIVKGAFDQGNLLETVEALIG